MPPGHGGVSFLPALGIRDRRKGVPGCAATRVSSAQGSWGGPGCGYIMIHVSWTLRPSCAGYTQDTLEIHRRHIQDTYPWLVLSALLPKELKALRLFVAGVGLHLGLALKGWHRCLSKVPHEPRLLLQCIRLNRLELKAHVEQLLCSCCKVGTPARRNARGIRGGYM